MDIKKDRKEQNYTEIEITGGFIRLTYIPVGWDKSPSIRIQIRDETGHLRQGPEIPVDEFGKLFDAVINFLIN